MSLTSFITDEFRPYYENNTGSKEIETTLVSAAVKQAARKISRYRPRLLKADLTITAGAFTVSFPANFARSSIAELYRAQTGIALDDPFYSTRYLDIWGASSFYFNIGSERFRADGKVYVRGYGSSVDSDSIQLTSNDSGIYGIYVEADEVAGATARTVKNFTYYALHEITDGSPAKDTITADLRDVLLDEVMAIVLPARARQLRREAATEKTAGLASAKNEAAAGLEAQAKDYGHRIKVIASIGNAA
jgi:hypothetical protein